ncbi:fungal-specific transcription factor domain-containing protein [Dichotomocladium elegans]|nr:fungal-specific transcription factor domain-containing protein [Dichotomocladium elegans]
MFEDPAPLRFRTLDILRRLTRDILEELAKEEADIQRNTGASLIIKSFGKESIYAGTQTKSNKKIKVSNACERCRKRKTGCDGYIPCETCMKQNHECHYAPGVTAPTRPALPSLPTPTEPSPVTPIPTHPSFHMDRFVGARATHHFSPQPTPILTASSQHELYTDSLGHFIGETSFFATHAQPAPIPAARVVFPHLIIPSLPLDTQVALVDTFCFHADAFFPCVMDKAALLAELAKCTIGQPSFLSPLFFCALFSRATSLISQDTLSDQLLHIALSHRDDYYDLPHFSTVLALVIMANQLEHKKLGKNLTRAWLLVGEAVRLAVDMGLHRTFRILSNGEDNPQAQWCIRTFWSLLVTERTMSLTYGRPSILDEKDIDIPAPKILAGEDENTLNWVDSLCYLTVMSNIAGKIMRYNYSVHTQLPGAFK